jgi:hypothetical protein
MDRGWLPAVTSAAALSVYGFAGEGGSPTLYLAAYRKPYGEVSMSKERNPPSLKFQKVFFME